MLTYLLSTSYDRTCLDTGIGGSFNASGGGSGQRAGSDVGNFEVDRRQRDRRSGRDRRGGRRSLRRRLGALHPGAVATGIPAQIRMPGSPGEDPYEALFAEPALFI